MTDPDLLFTAKIRNLTENELVVFFVCSVFYQIIFRANISEVLFVKSGAKVQLFF